MLTTTLNRLRRARRDDSGLTLLEMLAVILVVAILATGGFIAIQRIRGGAQSSVAKTNLNTAVTALVTAHGIEQDGQLPADIDVHLDSFLEDLAAEPYERPTTEVKGWQWASGPQPNEVFVALNTGPIADGASTPRWGVAAHDAVWLITKAEDGDTYCALVVLEISGATEPGGTRYDAAKSDNDVATCGLPVEATASAAVDGTVETAAKATDGVINVAPSSTDTPTEVDTVAVGATKVELSATIPDAN